MGTLTVTAPRPELEKDPGAIPPSDPWNQPWRISTHVTPARPGSNVHTFQAWGGSEDGWHHVRLPDRTGTWEELWQVPTVARPEVAALSRHPTPWRDGYTSIASGRPFLIARDAMLLTGSPETWEVVGDLTVYRKKIDAAPGDYIDVQRAAATRTPDAMLDELAKAGGDEVADVYAAITARFIAAGMPEGGIWVNVDDILRDRCLEPMRDHDGTSHGYRTEERLRIGQHFAELGKWWIKGRVTPWRPRGRQKAEPWELNSALLVVTDTFSQVATEGPPIPHAVRVVLGSYTRHFLASGSSARQTALMMQKALQYDPKLERTQKRLAYHLAFRWRLAAHDRDYTKPITVASLFSDAHIETDGKTERKNAGRTIQRWTQALNDLARDGVIANYRLLGDGDNTARSQLTRWLSQRIVNTPPITIKAHYESMGARNPKALKAPEGA